jgi:hypothetical protein
MSGPTSKHARQVPPLLMQTWETATNDPDPLVALGATRALGALLSTWEAKLASEAMASGATWEAIGSSVGVSRQAAWERFHHDVYDFHRQVKDAARTLKERQREEWKEFRDDMKRRARGDRRPFC